MTGGDREVVKLSLGKGQPMLNVLPVGLEGDTLTLVCPFPVLPLEIPVSVTLPGREDLGPVEATIRRVGVELMGESAIPRFKLHLSLGRAACPAGEEVPIRVEEVLEASEPFAVAGGEATEPEAEATEHGEDEAGTVEPGGADVVAAALEGAAEVDASVPGVDAPDEALGATAAEPEAIDVELPSVMVDVELAGVETYDEPGAATAREGQVEDPDRWKLPEGDVNWSAGSLLGLDLTGEEPDLTWPDELPGTATDPVWTERREAAPVPAGIDERSRRGSRWPVRTAVVLALLVSVFAVGYVLRAELAAAAGPIVGEELVAAVLGVAPARVEAGARRAAAVTPAAPAAPVAEGREGDEAGEGASVEATPADEPVPGVDASDEAEGEIGVVDALAGVGEGSELGADLPEGLAPGEIAAASAPAATADEPRVEVGGAELRVVLPTQRPVREARSYRLHDPTGIVVDVPGGVASERARWIDTAHERVRSVRVLEREDGVRFIIYLNDPVVPRYRVGYSRAGVTVDILGPDPRHVSTK
jgi:hypothetical protein